MPKEIKTTGTESAYPCPVGHIECTHPTGVTKRELFAAMAMQGMLAEFTQSMFKTAGMFEVLARQSVEAADALLSELNKP